MNIKEEKIIKARLMIKDRYLYTMEFFEALENEVNQDKLKGIEIDRKHGAKKIINRFSGQYMSPTNIKSFYYCPASQFIQSIVPWDSTAYTSMGITFHSIVEEFYNLPQGKRTLNKLDEFKEKYIKLNHSDSTERELNMINNYVEGFKNTGDYLNPNKPMNHNELVCYNEYFVKGTFKPLGVELPLPMYILMDRFDIRDEGLFVLDYKTGNYFKQETFSMDGYLPQVITFKWAIEDEYGEKIKDGFILTPGIENKIHKMDIHSLKNQSIYIEKCFDYAKRIEKVSNTKAFPIFKLDNLMSYIRKNNWEIEEYSDRMIIHAEYKYEI